MENVNKSNSFNEFWAGYLLGHDSRVSRAFHVGGVLVSVAFAAALVATGMVFFLVLATIPALLGAYVGHKLSPRHDGAFGGERPEWAALADVKMAALAVTGRLGREIERVRESSVRPSRPAWSHG